MLDHPRIALAGVYVVQEQMDDFQRPAISPCVLKRSRRLSPSGSGLEPEDLRGHVAVLGRVEQEASDLGIRFGLPKIKLLPVMFAQGLGVDTEHTRNIGL